MCVCKSVERWLLLLSVNRARPTWLQPQWCWLTIPSPRISHLTTPTTLEHLLPPGYPAPRMKLTSPTSTTRATCRVLDHSPTELTSPTRKQLSRATCLLSVATVPAHRFRHSSRSFIRFWSARVTRTTDCVSLHDQSSSRRETSGTTAVAMVTDTQSWTMATQCIIDASEKLLLNFYDWSHAKSKSHN